MERFAEVPGSVTAIEKEVVTKWFETHQNPQSIGVDWTDFFVQHVSGSHSNMDFFWLQHQMSISIILMLLRGL